MPLVGSSSNKPLQPWLGTEYTSNHFSLKKGLISMFQPSEHLMNVGTDKKPRMYLEVKYRLVWLREQEPDAQITTEILQLDLDREVSAEVSEWDDR